MSHLLSTTTTRQPFQSFSDCIPGIPLHTQHPIHRVSCVLLLGGECSPLWVLWPCLFAYISPSCTARLRALPFLSFSPVYCRSHYDERFASTRAKLTRLLRSPGLSIALSRLPSHASPSHRRLSGSMAAVTFTADTNINQKVHWPAHSLRYHCRRRVVQCSEGVREPERAGRKPSSSLA